MPRAGTLVRAKHVLFLFIPFEKRVFQRNKQKYMLSVTDKRGLRAWTLTFVAIVAVVENEAQCEKRGNFSKAEISRFYTAVKDVGATSLLTWSP